ncbi:hypothetical protein AG4045_020530 [Apium graveolens]|uniref:Uncharacterized protein n=1 Tax=Apium graveolens TaxID=4045 RepID=A0A6L5BCJ1_APIGR|nr:hypothetical protein AG4045_020530 [Apium graveolens]
MAVGVLALQGSFNEHIAAFSCSLFPDTSCKSAIFPPVFNFQIEFIERGSTLFLLGLLPLIFTDAT